MEHMKLDLSVAVKTPISDYQTRYTMPDGTVYSAAILPGAKFPFRTTYRLSNDGTIAERVE